MKWNVQSLFTGEQERLQIRDTLDLSDWEFQGHCPLKQPVSVEGEAVAAHGAVLLRLTAHYRFEAICDRCLAPVVRDGSLVTEHVLVTSAEDEDNGDLVVLEEYQLDLDELCGEDIWLELPTKTLCREDCRGLCTQCGQNLNERLCGCSAKTVDPRLAALSQLIE